MESNTNEATVTAVENKKSRIEATAGRIAYEENALRTKQERLEVLKVGSKAHVRCVESIRKTEALLNQLRSSLSARLSKQAAANDAAPAAELDQVG